MVSEGQVIKNKIQGTQGLNVSIVARKLGISSQLLDYHLKKQSPPKALKEKIFGILKDQEKENENYDKNHNTVESLQSVTHKRLNKDDKQDYISTPLIKSVLTMGMLLKMSHEQLMSLLSEETNAENFKLIQEVISTKKEIEHLKEQNTTLKKYADSLEKQIRQ